MKHTFAFDTLAMPPFSKRRDQAEVFSPRLHASKPLLLAAISLMSMTPFAVEAWTLDFSPNSYSVNEADGTATVNVRVASVTGDYGSCTISGTVVATGGSASSGEDYTISGGTFSFNVPFAIYNTSEYVATAPIGINIVDDALVEGAETINLSIQSPTIICSDSNDTVSVAGSAIVNINDNDTAPPPEPTPPNPTPNLFDNPNFTPNQRSVYEGLLSACENATGELLARCNEVSNADLDSIIPDEVAAQGTMATDFGFKQFSIIHGRIVNLRNSQQQNSTLLGYSTININGENIPVGKALMTALGPALGGAAGDDSSAEPFRDSPLGFFIKGQFNVGDKKASRNEQGFDVERKSMTVGLDYSLTDDLVLGAAFGYGGTENTYFNNNGRMETDAFEFSTYGSYFLPSDFYVDWVLSYALHNFDTKRRIQLNGLDTTADSSPDGDQYGVSLGFGKDIAIQDVIINPYIRLEYLNTQVDAYRENGGAGLGLEFDSQEIESTSSTVGGQASKAISLSWGILSPSIRFEWVHQYMDDSRLIQARFANASAGAGKFTVLTDNPDRDYFNIGSSLAVNLPEGRAGFLRYEYRLGQSDITDHTVELGARIPF
ncbi:autotransporter family protein [Methylomonas rapida]|uniref:Autotransporter domain-containing protein n=1 Tax=Methylomonas rapida TaxID=2963939 RepID=A0ABY7GIN9_9GAMM|nr:autotransporter domain-containing protein [Methylomonas rapida]WAR43958.1 autotransporter domain-containing protein [Methylomonas rapida]